MLEDQVVLIWIISLLVINLIVAVVYLIINVFKKERKEKYYIFLFFLIFPVVGELFIILSYLCERLIRLLKKKDLDMKELSFNKTRMKLLTSVDMEKALDAVPIEEALIVSEKKEKRGAFIDVLKQDDYNYMMGKIKGAVENNDMEVAHYAATFVTDSIAKFKANEAKLRKAVDDEESLESIIEYVDFMQENLNQKIYSIVELRVYISLFEKAASILYEQDPDKLKDATISKMAELLEVIGDSEKLEIWMARATGRHRESLECFKLCARYYYKKGNREKLAELLREVGRLSVPLDSEALEWVRILKLRA